MTDRGSPASPVPQGVQDELRRLGERWQQLPRTQALRYAGRVHALVQALADRVAQAQRAPSVDVPDLGPAVVMDQLRVLAYDAAAAGVGDGLEEALAALRRALP
ncbi:MAG: hypothetical protein WCG47_20655 [Dermatophilaceae bacterium]